MKTPTVRVCPYCEELVSGIEYACCGEFHSEERKACINCEDEQVDTDNYDDFCSKDCSQIYNSELGIDYEP